MLYAVQLVRLRYIHTYIHAMYGTYAKYVYSVLMMLYILYMNRTELTR